MKNASTTSQQQQRAAAPGWYFDMQQCDATLWMMSVKNIQNDPRAARIVLDLFNQHPELRAKRPGAYVAAQLAKQRSDDAYSAAFQQGRSLGRIVGLLRCAVGGLKAAAVSAADLVAATVQTEPRKAAPALDGPDLGQADLAAAVREASDSELPSGFPEIDWNFVVAVARDDGSVGLAFAAEPQPDATSADEDEMSLRASAG